MLVNPVPILPPEPIVLPQDGFESFSQYVLLPFLLLGVFMLITWITLRAARERYFNPNILPWMLLALGIGFAMLLAHGVSLQSFQGLLLCSVLLYASIADIRTHEVPDYIWVMILLISFIGFKTDFLFSMITGAVAVFIPQLTIAMVKPGSYGGADIKISTSLAFLLGVGKGLFAVIVGLTIALIVMAILRLKNKLKKEEPYPIVPFLSIGAITAFLL